jgi:transglutaminase-like putative cysteine protease
MELRIRHITRFSYYAPVSESAMEMRLHPRTDAQQRCLAFNLVVTPSASSDSYSDYLGNVIYTFDIPKRHRGGKWPARSLP